VTATDDAWALTPAALDRVLDEIDAGRRTVVECGSGRSTVAIARRLAAHGHGGVWSLEHDRAWAARTRSALMEAGVEDHSRVVEAPRRRLRLGLWYDPAALRSLPRGVQLLLVDGPPGDLDPQGTIRHPALGALRDRLEDGALVILDDIHRPGEQKVVERWRAEHGIAFELHPQERLAIGVFSGLAETSTVRERER